jgi:hypothetical protein
MREGSRSTTRRADTPFGSPGVIVEYAVWNTLHDGSIDSIRGDVPGDVTLQIGIGYLCKKLPTASDYVNVHLRRCTRFEFHPFEGPVVTDLAILRTRDLEILSAEPEESGVSVCSFYGFLKLANDEVETRLAEGNVVPQSELEAAADRYWSEWAANSRRADR